MMYGNKRDTIILIDRHSLKGNNVDRIKYCTLANLTKFSVYKFYDAIDYAQRADVRFKCLLERASQYFK